MTRSSLSVVIYSRKKKVQHKWQQHINDSSHETELWDLSSVFAMVWLHWKDNLSPEHSNRDFPFSQKNRFMHLLSSWQKNSGVIVLIILIKENEMHGAFPMIQLSTCKFNWHTVWCKLLHALNVSLKFCDIIVITSLDYQKKIKFRSVPSRLLTVYSWIYHSCISFFLLWRMFCIIF